MMRKQYGLLLCLLFLMNHSFAYSGYGICNYGKETVSAIVCYGPTVLKGTTVTGDIKVTGSLQAESISAEGLLIEGSATLSDARINSFVNVAGDFSADHVTFKKGVAITSHTIAFNHSTVGGLVTITSAEKTPYVQVQCSTVINGAILFDGKSGVVQITGDSIVKGKVVNGSMEFVERTCY
jgi:cytoskeletal protein CcmA (bactofilin family)